MPVAYLRPHLQLKWILLMNFHQHQTMEMKSLLVRIYLDTTYLALATALW